jgi:hypothetical protein
MYIYLIGLTVPDMSGRGQLACPRMQKKYKEEAR